MLYTKCHVTNRVMGSHIHDAFDHFIDPDLTNEHTFVTERNRNMENISITVFRKLRDDIQK